MLHTYSFSYLFCWSSRFVWSHVQEPSRHMTGNYKLEGHNKGE